MDKLQNRLEALERSMSERLEQDPLRILSELTAVLEATTEAGEGDARLQVIDIMEDAINRFDARR